MQATSHIRQQRGDTAWTEDEVFHDHSHQFQAHLEGEGYSPASLKRYGRCIDTLGALMRRHEISLADLGEAQMVELIAKSESAWYRACAIYPVRRFFQFLVEQGAAAPVVAVPPQECARTALRRDYETYLRCQRGLCEATIHCCWLVADRFLVFRFGDETGDPSKISQLDIAEFLQQVHSRRQPYRVKTTSTHLRKFLQYLFKEGRTKTNFALGVPSVARRDRTRLRGHLTPEQVEALLDAVRSDTQKGRRDYAMVMLMARLGLRPPEVVAVRLEDIDWRAGEIVVRGKGRLFDRVPLPQDVGEALANYIRLARVAKSRMLFVSVRAPHAPFKDSQVLNQILRGAFARTGLTPPAPYVGSHILRHSLATNLVRRGASLEEIADMLRHRSRASTMLYARLDVDGLRSIAQPWPVAGGVK